MRRFLRRLAALKARLDERARAIAFTLDWQRWQRRHWSFYRHTTPGFLAASWLFG